MLGQIAGVNVFFHPGGAVLTYFNRATKVRRTEGLSKPTPATNRLNLPSYWIRKTPIFARFRRFFDDPFSAPTVGTSFFYCAMNNLIPFVSRLLPLVLLAMIGLMGCSKSDEEATPKTLPDLIREDAQYEFLRAAITRAGLTDQLKAANLTIFAPTNAAFQAGGFAAVTDVSALPVETAKSLVLYHVLPGSVLVADIPTGTNVVLKTGNGGTAYLTKTASNSALVTVNNVALVKTDIAAANGTIHQIERVLTPSQPSVLAAANANPNLSYFAAALARAALANPALAALLTSPASNGPAVTVFAPTNAAFQAAGYSSPASFSTVSGQTLASILGYHAVNGVYFANQIQSGQLTTLNTARINVVTSGSGVVSIKGNQNTTFALVQAAPGRDIPIQNGVLHLIDQVLRP
jgi:uncharacterized surface protein with fasciclin (FAS1) repeats